MPTKRDIIIFYILSFTWGLPFTLVGLFIFLFVLLFMRKHIKLSIVAGRVSVVFIDKNFGGVCLGVVYMVGMHNKLWIHKHELGHTIQNIRFGPFILPLALSSLIRAAFWKRIKAWYKKRNKEIAYDDYWFEGQATRLGNKYFSQIVIKD